MDPAYEQRLREEVIYLHSLWHQGPPRPNAPNPNPYPTTHSITTANRPPRKRKRIRTHTQSRDSGIEWPCKTPPQSLPANDAGWPAVWGSSSSSERPPLTTEQLARLASTQAQKAALKAVTEFLGNRENADDEDEEESADEIEDEDIDDATDGGEGCGNLGFFVKLFKEDSELREYYEKNYACGEFSCLVCYAVGKRSWKKYKECLALVQHSVSISKTKGRQAHRAYGQAICKVLGWDINRLPSSIDSIDNGPIEFQGNDNDSGKDASSVPGSNAELMTMNSVGPEESTNNENLGANNGGSAPLEGNIDNHAEDDLKLPDCIKDLENVNSREVPLQDKSTNNENLQDSIENINTREVPLQDKSTNNENLQDSIENINTREVPLQDKSTNNENLQDSIENINTREVPLQDKSTNDESLQDSIENVNTREVPLQDNSTNDENLQDNVGNVSATLEEPAKEDAGVA